jgi:hypothetical protein
MGLQDFFCEDRLAYKILELGYKIRLIEIQLTFQYVATV